MWYNFYKGAREWRIRIISTMNGLAIDDGKDLY